jgi:PAS domain S-box-containing protein
LQGLDLGVLPACAASLQAAVVSGLCTATPSFRFVQDGVQSPSMAVFQPVYKTAGVPGAEPRGLLGFVAAVVHLPELLTRGLNATSMRHGRLQAALVDYSQGVAPEVLAAYQLEQERLAAWLRASPTHLPPEFYADPVPIFGRAYAFLALPGSDFWRYALLGRPGLIVVGGLLLTGLLAGFVAYSRHEQIRLEAQVRTRTEALRASEERFRQLVETSADAISLIRAGVFVDCNTATTRFLGLPSKDALIGKTPLDISPPLQPDGRSSEEKAADVMRMAEEAGHHSFDWLHTRADGSTVLVDVMLTPVTVRGTRLLMAVWRDITERRKAQEAQLALERHLLERQKLESLGILAGGIAHDFNNILMAILGYAELAQEQVTYGSSLHEDLRQIMAAARRAADLCAQMLAYTGKGALTRQPVQLRTLIQEMNDLLRLSISKKVHLDIALTDVPPVIGDASQLGQVVLNLIINASEAMEGREGTVSVGLVERIVDGASLPAYFFDREMDPGSYALLTVKDTGCGMDDATRKRIFEPFFTTKFTGRGLGLAAVLGIVKAHHGTMGLETAPGAGTTFHVLLPTAVATTAPAAGAAPPIEATPVPLDQACILLVDDEPQVLAVAAKTLQRAGYEVLTAEGGREAVECFRSRPDDIALVILDLTMPDIDGLEAVPLLRAINPYVRVVLSSGFSREDVSKRLGTERVQGVLQKPYARRDLLDMVARILEG